MRVYSIYVSNPHFENPRRYNCASEYCDTRDNFFIFISHMTTIDYFLVGRRTTGRLVVFTYVYRGYTDIGI